MFALLRLRNSCPRLLNSVSFASKLREPATGFKYQTSRAFTNAAFQARQYNDRNIASQVDRIVANSLRKPSFQEKTAYFDSILKEMTINGSEQLTELDFLSFIKAQHKSGLKIDLEKGKQLLESNGLQLSPRILNYYIEASCLEGDMEQASSYLNELRAMDAIPNEHVMRSILYGYVKNRSEENIEATKRMMSQMGFWPSFSAKLTMAYALADIANAKALIELFPELEAKMPISLSALTQIYSNLAQSKAQPQDDDMAEAKKLILEKMSHSELDPPVKRKIFGLHLYKMFLNQKYDDALNLMKATGFGIQDERFLTTLPSFIPRGSAGDAAIKKLYQLVAYEFEPIENMIKYQLTGEAISRLIQLTASPVKYWKKLFNRPRISRKALISVLQLKDQMPTDVFMSHALPNLLYMDMPVKEILEIYDGSEKEQSIAALGILLHSVKNDCQNELEASVLLDRFAQAGYFPYKNSIFKLERIILNSTFSMTNDQFQADKASCKLDLLLEAFSTQTHPSFLRSCLSYTVNILNWETKDSIAKSLLQKATERKINFHIDKPFLEKLAALNVEIVSESGKNSNKDLQDSIMQGEVDQACHLIGKLKNSLIKPHPLQMVSQNQNLSSAEELQLFEKCDQRGLTNDFQVVDQFWTKRQDMLDSLCQKVQENPKYKRFLFRHRVISEMLTRDEQNYTPVLINAIQDEKDLLKMVRYMSVVYSLQPKLTLPGLESSDDLAWPARILKNRFESQNFMWSINYLSETLTSLVRRKDLTSGYFLQQWAISLNYHLRFKPIEYLNLITALSQKSIDRLKLEVQIATIASDLPVSIVRACDLVSDQGSEVIAQKIGREIAIAAEDMLAPKRYRNLIEFNRWALIENLLAVPTSVLRDQATGRVNFQSVIEEMCNQTESEQLALKLWQSWFSLHAFQSVSTKLDFYLAALSCKHAKLRDEVLHLLKTHETDRVATLFHAMKNSLTPKTELLELVSQDCSLLLQHVVEGRFDKIATNLVQNPSESSLDALSIVGLVDENVIKQLLTQLTTQDDQDMLAKYANAQLKALSSEPSSNMIRLFSECSARGLKFSIENEAFKQIMIALNSNKFYLQKLQQLYKEAALALHDRKELAKSAQMINKMLFSGQPFNQEWIKHLQPFLAYQQPDPAVASFARVFFYAYFAVNKLSASISMLNLLATSCTSKPCLFLDQVISASRPITRSIFLDYSVILQENPSSHYEPMENALKRLFVPESNQPDRMIKQASSANPEDDQVMLSKMPIEALAKQLIDEPIPDEQMRTVFNEMITAWGGLLRVSHLLSHLMSLGAVKTVDQIVDCSDKQSQTFKPYAQLARIASDIICGQFSKIDIHVNELMQCPEQYLTNCMVSSGALSLLQIWPKEKLHLLLKIANRIEGCASSGQFQSKLFANLVHRGLIEEADLQKASRETSQPDQEDSLEKFMRNLKTHSKYSTLVPMKYLAGTIQSSPLDMHSIKNGIKYITMADQKYLKQYLDLCTRDLAMHAIKTGSTDHLNAFCDMPEVQSIGLEAFCNAQTLLHVWKAIKDSSKSDFIEKVTKLLTARNLLPRSN